MTELKDMTDDDLHEMIVEARAEQRRRKEEKKLPVFLVDGTYYKSLSLALKELEDDVSSLASKSEEQQRKAFGKWLTDGVDRRRFGLKIEFWSESEYSARPDQVFGGPFE